VWLPLMPLLAIGINGSVAGHPGMVLPCESLQLVIVYAVVVLGLVKGIAVMFGGIVPPEQTGTGGVAPARGFIFSSPSEMFALPSAWDLNFN